MKSINLTNKLVRDAHFCNSSLRSKTKMAGFSMMESVLSVFVLSMGIVGVMSLLVSSMRHSMDSRDTIIATELAQEGLELVRNVRDNNVAQGVADFTNIPAPGSSNCRVGYNSAIICDADYGLNYADGFYSSGGATSKFKRGIEIGGVATQLTITSSVTWNGSNPISGPTAATCNVNNKCTFAKSVLVAR